MNKQIDEIVKVLVEGHHKMDVDWTNHFMDSEKFPKPKSEHEILAEALYNANYRKYTDVAREIADEIKRYLRLNEDIAIKCKRENGEKNEEYWKGKLSAFLQIRGFIDTEIKKKNESEGADDDG